jgi:hypothetical protein
MLGFEVGGNEAGRSALDEGGKDEEIAFSQGLGEAMASRENLGRPLYLDMQVRQTFSRHSWGKWKVTKWVCKWWQATTPTDPRVLDAMLPFLTNQYGNPHSRTHAYGWETEKAVDAAREVGIPYHLAPFLRMFWLRLFQHVASLIGANPKDIVFTSGATETNNMAIKGIARFHRKSGKKHIITTQTEHKCVLDSCRYLQDEGFDVSYLPVQVGSRFVSRAKALSRI